MRTDKASRTITAPRDRVFQAFVKREEIVRWLPPAGARAILEEFEPAPDGPFRMTLIFAGSGSKSGETSQNSDKVQGKFVEITPPERIVQQFTFVSDDPKFEGTMLMTWALDETPTGTLVSVVAENVPEGISAEDHQLGMTSSLESLAAIVEASS